MYSPSRSICAITTRPDVLSIIQYGCGVSVSVFLVRTHPRRLRVDVSSRDLVLVDVGEGISAMPGHSRMFIRHEIG